MLLCYVLTSLVFLQQFNVKNSQKLAKIGKIEESKSSYLLTNLMGFSKVFRKNVTCNNIKIRKNPFFFQENHFSRKHNFRKSRGELSSPNPLQPFTGLMSYIYRTNSVKIFLEENVHFEPCSDKYGFVEIAVQFFTESRKCEINLSILSGFPIRKVLAIGHVTKLQVFTMTFINTLFCQK